MSLKDKVVIVTEADLAFGRELSRQLVAAGALVVAVGQDEQALLAAGEGLDGEHYFAQVVNLGEQAATAEFYQWFKQRWPRADIVFNNPWFHPKVNFLDESPVAWDALIARNLNSVAYLLKAVLPDMVAANAGKIFNLGSWARLNPTAESAVYTSARGAIACLTKAIAQDLASRAEQIEIHEWIPGHIKMSAEEAVGLEPSLVAGWGVKLAAGPGFTTKNCVIAGHQEWQPRQSLKAKLAGKLLFWR
ncbi:SDR family NAD(P)-dependent oxidoreductase [Halioxenophilus sp. WMMB6]|uniref:SDR family NAD(P)-dependent oxidoreductase n=1 Tax=Halioxenophilus sp. WMMB6 TaxID=3073815 RepID=UPI00295E89A0|nr:SDR family NAD(P)-dependent oxidoreductase [Halioxenophilus sp. WMMB6]